VVLYQSRPPLIVHRAPECGAALISALIVVALLTTLGAALVLVVTTECLVSANHRTAQQSLYGADAGLERAIGALRTLPTWRAIPSTGGSSFSDFNDGQTTPRIADGTTLDLVRLTRERQAESDAFFPAAPDRPVWRRFGHATLDRMVSGGVAASPYVIVWIADDPGDQDGDPDQDSNDIVIVRSVAIGPRGTKRMVEASIQRETAIDATMPGAMRTDVRVISWREVR
jgi:hypothetical protein